MTRNLRLLIVMPLLLTLLLIPQLTPLRRLGHPFTLAPVDPLGSFEGPGLAVSFFYTGDGQRISNPSFETGSAQPWFQYLVNGALGSGTSVVGPGFEGSLSARLRIVSGNFSSYSFQSLVADLSLEEVGLASARLRVSVQVESIAGISSSDRVEESITFKTSLGETRRIHYLFAAGALPSNTTSDVYLTVTGFGTLGQWLTIDRDLETDALAAFGSGSASLSSVSEIDLSVYSQTSRILFADTNSNNIWDTGESVVFDTNSNGVYNAGEPVIYPPEPSVGRVLKDDPKVVYVDLNSNNVWDAGEAVVYDSNKNLAYDSGETMISGSAPGIGTPLDRLVVRTTQALFDRVEFYSATGNHDWVLNGGFETSGLAGWGYVGGFTESTATFHSGSRSAKGNATGQLVEMAQSFEARPQVESWTRFLASVDTTVKTGASFSDKVDIWLGLMDSQGSPAFLYYYFNTGDSSIPSNSTSTLNFRVAGFGGEAQWLSIDRSLQQDATALTGYTPPYRLELVVLEVGASTASLTEAYFDDLSIREPYKLGAAPSYYYGVSGRNSTYVYTASTVPHGAFYLDMPLGQSILNITNPEGLVLQQGEYSTSIQAGSRRIQVPAGTSFKSAPVGDWGIFTTSANAVFSVYAEDAATGTRKTAFNPGSSANLAFQSRDPLNNALAGVTATLTLWTSGGVNVGTWSGLTDSQGTFRVQSITLPSAPGEYWLQATVSSSYVGIQSVLFSVLYELTISINISANQVSAGASVTVSGEVSPARQEVNVTISYRQAGTSEWSTLSTVKTDANGRYSYSWTPPEGDYEVIASIGDQQILPAQSPRELLSILPAVLPPELLLGLVSILGAAVAVVLAILLVRRRRKPTETPGQPSGNSSSTGKD